MTTANDEPEDVASIRPAMTPILKRIGLILVFLWFLFGGVAHFSLTEVEMRIVPPVIPWPAAASSSARVVVTMIEAGSPLC